LHSFSFKIADLCVQRDEALCQTVLMKKLILIATPFWLFLLTACGSPEVGAVTSELKSAAKAAASDAMSEAGLAAGGLMTTQNACLLAGQSEVFCGCLSTELGDKLDASHIDGLTTALKTGLGGDIKGALKDASTIDPDTRAALTKCGTRAAISGAIGQ
jgi:hypothetical protein